MKKAMSFLLIVLVLVSIGLSSLSATAAELDNTALVSDENNNTETIIVPQIRVTTANGNGTTLQKADDYVDATITITDTDSTVLTDSIKFKVRGNSTAQPNITKKAFTIKFDSKKDVLNMGKAKKWSLLANTFDPTLMRNYIAFDFAQNMGLGFTSQQRIVELYLDDSYRGCYVLTEPVEQGSTRVDIDIDSNDGMKDFLVELEKDRFESDVSYFTTSNIRFAVKEPEEPNDEQLTYISTTMDDIMNVIKEGNQEEISKRIDIPSFTRYYLLNELFKTLDFDYSSVFFYYKDGVLYSGPAWDYDLAAGNANPSSSQVSTASANPEGLYATDCNIYKYLCSYDWFNDEIRSTYLQYYDYINNITADGGLIDNLLETYGIVFERNFSDAGWSPSQWWVYEQLKPLSTYSDNVKYLSEWLHTRNIWLRRYYNLFDEEYSLGDIDEDGSITVIDATYIQRHIAKTTILTPSQLDRADTSKDGEVSVIDATTIQRVVAKITPEL